MSLPVAKRPYDVFLSHAHVDKIFVGELYSWLSEVSGMNVWYDARQMPGAVGIARALKQGIEQSRGAIVVASEEAISRGWVQQEVDIALDERARSRDFHVIVLRIAGADVDQIIRGLPWIDVPDKKLTPDVAAGILFAFYSVENWPDPTSSRDVYVSASWRSTDNMSALAVCRQAAQTGFRLIGDSNTQRGFSDRRVESIIASCGGAIVIIPYRDCEIAQADEGPYKYFLRELDIAQTLNLPTLVIADPRVQRRDGNDREWHRLHTECQACPPAITSVIDVLWHDWLKPSHAHYVFYATDLESEAARRGSNVRRLIELVTGMATRVGTDVQVHTGSLQGSITEEIRNAFLVIADISGETDTTFNVDVCIESAMAFIMGRNLQLLASGKTRRPPFMLRDISQFVTYRNAIDQLGEVRRLAWDYRRRVINIELNSM
jgi:hypothetical protein